MALIRKSFLASLLLCFLLLGCAPRQAQAQYIGSVGLQTTNELAILNGVSTPSTATVRNIGQTAHTVTYRTSGTVTGLEIVIEGSSDGSSFTTISDVGIDFSGGTITARGYYPVIQINLRSFSGGGLFTADYSATQVTAGETRGAESSTTVSFLVLTSSSALNTTQTFTIFPGFGNTAGVLYLNQFGASPCTVGGRPLLSVQVRRDPTGSSGFLERITERPIDCSQTATTLVIPQVPAFGLRISYNANGTTSAGTYSLRFSFSSFASVASPSSFFGQNILLTGPSGGAGGFTTPGTSTPFYAGAYGFSQHTITLTVSGAPTTCTFDLEGSADGGSVWFSLSGPITCTSSTMFHVVQRPVPLIRANLSALAGGASPNVDANYFGVK